MKQRIYKLLSMVVAAGLLTACGGEYAGVSENGAVSGGAVSGSGVSPLSVSGSAVKDTDRNERGEENGHWFCSDSHVYYVNWFLTEEPVLVERSLADGSERRTEIIGLNRVCYVDNSWVYFITDEDPDDGVDGVLDDVDDCSYVWRAPIEQSQVNVQKKELLLTEKEEFDFSATIYCDGRYVLYSTFCDDIYKKYDLQQKKFIGNTGKALRDYSGEVLAVSGETAFIGLEEEGLVAQQLNSGEITWISDSSSLVYEHNLAVTDKDLFFNDAGEMEICQYHIEDGSRKKLTMAIQVEKLLKKEGFLNVSRGKDHQYYGDQMFVYGDRLYIQIDVSWTEKEVIYRNKVILSLDIRSGGLRYEKELTDCLANPKESQTVVEKQYAAKWIEDTLFLSRGTCIGIAEGKCYMNLYNPDKDRNMAACYDLDSGKFKFITKKDPEWYMWYYDRHESSWIMYEGAYVDDMPNNKSDSGLLEEGGYWE